MGSALAIGIDIGGTHLRAAVVDTAGVCHQFTQQPTATADAVALTDQIAHTIATFDVTLPIGVAIAGLVDGEGTIQASPNLATLAFPFPLQQILGERTGRTVWVGNDATAAAIGEHRFGAGFARDSMLLVTIGTGVGCGIIVNHQPLTGTHGYAGEFGHMLLDIASAVAGQPNTVETYLSGRGLATRATQITGNPTSTPELCGAAARGETWATELLDDAARVLGGAFANAVNMLDVAVCVLGGGAGVALYPHLKTGTVDTLNNHLLGDRQLRPAPPFMVATQGDSAGVIGAAVMAAGRKSG